ncbi:hypothetical protein LTR85_004757 [Meristemomyces frigidus]|nr:hypothetical protein LTR85_004757 [Meristemomyces frigidus]
MRHPVHKVLLYDECTDEELTPGWGGAIFLDRVNNAHSRGNWRDSDTKVEFFVDQTDGVSWFDVSHIGGFSLPTTVFGNDKKGGCAVDKLVGCPVEWQVREREDGPVLQCRNDGSEAAKRYFEYECPNTYVRYNDDAQGTKAATGFPTHLDVIIKTA